MPEYIRLSDKIHDALEMAIEQDAVDTAHHLYNALETALTRKTGGAGFVEKRGDLDPHILDIIKAYKEFMKAHGK